MREVQVSFDFTQVAGGGNKTFPGCRREAENETVKVNY